MFGVGVIWLTVDSRGRLIVTKGRNKFGIQLNIDFFF